MYLHISGAFVFPTEVGDDPRHPPAFPPVITRQPSSITVEFGQKAVLHCEASGDHLIYDW